MYKTLTIPVEIHKGDIVTWNWELESGDINCKVLFKDGEVTTDVFKKERIHSHESSFEALNDGTLSFFFDNSFSWVNSKTVIGIIDIKA